MRAPRNDTPAQSPQASQNDTIESVPMDDLSVAVTKVLIPLATIFSWIAQILPPLAALASILWIGYQWYHSAPMKKRRNMKGRK